VEEGGVFFGEIDGLGLGLLEVAAEGLFKVLTTKEDVFVNLGVSVRLILSGFW